MKTGILIDVEERPVVLVGIDLHGRAADQLPLADIKPLDHRVHPAFERLEAGHPGLCREVLQLEVEGAHAVERQLAECREVVLEIPQLRERQRLLRLGKRHGVVAGVPAVEGIDLRLDFPARALKGLRERLLCLGDVRLGF